MASSRLRVSLIGCGSQGRYLCEALTIAGDIDFAGCADLDGERADAAAARFGFGAVFEDYRTLLEQTDTDAVIVATTHDQLQPAALAAVRAGKHVFVEKPMALNAADGRALADEAEEQDVRVMVGYALRFKPDRLRLKRLFDEGVIGEPLQVLAGQCIGGLGGWLARVDRGGGPLLYVGSHALDQILWLVDSAVERVYAEMHRRPGEVEQDALLTLRFRHGVTAQLVTSQTLGGRYGWLDVLGSRGRLRSEWESLTLTVESRVVDEYRHLTHLDIPFNAELPPLRDERAASVQASYYIRMWAAEMVEFLDAVALGREPSCSARDGVRLLEVVDAAHASAAQGIPISLG